MHGGKRIRYTQELRDQKLAKDKIKIESYNHLQNIVLENKISKKYDERTLEQTTVLLDLNPEFYTIWNYRRDILKQLYEDECGAGNDNPQLIQKYFVNELRFIFKQLQKNPKCYWIWNHRVWCLERINDKAVYEQELEFVTQMLAKDERNFHGWAYRRIMISAIERFIKDNAELFALTVSEFNYTTKMINKNISNYSAWHNRSKLIIKIFEQQDQQLLASEPLFTSKLKFLNNELDLLINAMYMDSEDSSIWIYIRWLITTDYFCSSVEEKIPFLTKLRDTITELNELEKDENNGVDNAWCLKTLKNIENYIQSSSI